MRISLVTEGTYPFAHGGVSVWCDQLVRGLTEHTFEISAITGTGSEALVYELPSNISAVRSIPLWSDASEPRLRAERRLVQARSGRIEFGRPDADFAAAAVAHDLADALLEPRLDRAGPKFTRALRNWSSVSASFDVEPALVSPTFLTMLMDRWGSRDLSERWGGRDRGLPTVGDAVTAARLLAHALRPLMLEPPKADLTHLVANGLAGLIGLSSKWTHGTPYVLSEHGIYLRERYLSFGRSLYSWPVKWLLLRFHRLLTNSVYSEASLVAPGNVYNQRWEVWDGVPDSAIRTVYNGVDPDEFAMSASEPEVPTIAWVGRIDPIKDLETLIRSFALVLAKIPEARLRIFGGTPRGNEEYHAQMVSLADQLGIAASVSFEGRVDVIRDAYDAGNVVVLTSISEGFPYTIIEAMSCGRATVSSNVGGVKEAVGDAGLVVRPRDVETFAQACVFLLQDDEARQRYAERARNRVVELFTLERSLDSFRTIYRDVTAGELPTEMRSA